VGENQVRFAPYLIIGIFEVLLGVCGHQIGLPLRVIGYLGFCPGHASACEHEVSNVDATMRLTYVADQQYCPPAKLDRTRDERQTLAWLSAHPSTRHLPATIGIRVAPLASYHCQIKLAGAPKRQMRGRIAN
jgi:hypothetical protein